MISSKIIKSILDFSSKINIDSVPSLAKKENMSFVDLGFESTPEGLVYFFLKDYFKTLDTLKIKVEDVIADEITASNGMFVNNLSSKNYMIETVDETLKIFYMGIELASFSVDEVVFFAEVTCKNSEVHMCRSKNLLVDGNFKAVADGSTFEAPAVLKVNPDEYITENEMKLYIGDENSGMIGKLATVSKKTEELLDVINNEIKPYFEMKTLKDFVSFDNSSNETVELLCNDGGITFPDGVMFSEPISLYGSYLSSSIAKRYLNKRESSSIELKFCDNIAFLDNDNVLKYITFNDENDMNIKIVFNPDDGSSALEGNFSVKTISGSAWLTLDSAEVSDFKTNHNIISESGKISFSYKDSGEEKTMTIATDIKTIFLKNYKYEKDITINKGLTMNLAKKFTIDSVEAVGYKFYFTNETYSDRSAAMSFGFYTETETRFGVNQSGGINLKKGIYDEELGIYVGIKKLSFDIKMSVLGKINQGLISDKYTLFFLPSGEEVCVQQGTTNSATGTQVVISGNYDANTGSIIITNTAGITLSGLTAFLAHVSNSVSVEGIAFSKLLIDKNISVNYTIETDSNKFSMASNVLFVEKEIGVLDILIDGATEQDITIKSSESDADSSLMIDGKIHYFGSSFEIGVDNYYELLNNPEIDEIYYEVYDGLANKMNEIVPTAKNTFSDPCVTTFRKDNTGVVTVDNYQALVGFNKENLSFKYKPDLNLFSPYSQNIVVKINVRKRTSADTITYTKIFRTSMAAAIPDMYINGTLINTTNVSVDSRFDFKPEFNNGEVYCARECEIKMTHRLDMRTLESCIVEVSAINECFIIPRGSTIISLDNSFKLPSATFSAIGEESNSLFEVIDSGIFSKTVKFLTLITDPSATLQVKLTIKTKSGIENVYTLFEKRKFDIPIVMTTSLLNKGPVDAGYGKSALNFYVINPTDSEFSGYVKKIKAIIPFEQDGYETSEIAVYKPKVLNAGLPTQECSYEKITVTPGIEQINYKQYRTLTFDYSNPTNPGMGYIVVPYLKSVEYKNSFSLDLYMISQSDKEIGKVLNQLTMTCNSMISRIKGGFLNGTITAFVQPEVEKRKFGYMGVRFRSKPEHNILECIDINSLQAEFEFDDEVIENGYTSTLVNVSTFTPKYLERSFWINNTTVSDDIIFKDLNFNANQFLSGVSLKMNIKNLKVLIGDSSDALIRLNTIDCFTRDDSFIKKWMKSRESTEHEMRNIFLAGLEVVPNIGTFAVRFNDVAGTGVFEPTDINDVLIMKPIDGIELGFIDPAVAEGNMPYGRNISFTSSVIDKPMYISITKSPTTYPIEIKCPFSFDNLVATAEANGMEVRLEVKLGDVTKYLKLVQWGGGDGSYAGITSAGSTVPGTSYMSRYRLKIDTVDALNLVELLKLAGYERFTYGESVTLSTDIYVGNFGAEGKKYKLKRSGGALTNIIITNVDPSTYISDLPTTIY